MDILRYNELDITGYESEYENIEILIQNHDFHGANVKKLLGTPYYRAKLDYTNRLLFRVIQYEGKKYALMLEVIPHHDYKNSRFLHGAKIDESKIDEVDINSLDELDTGNIPYINPKSKSFHVLDRVISFDDVQNEALELLPSTIIIGSAGSGKTILALEKMKRYDGEILYVTSSPYLVKNARNLYYSNQYSNPNQKIHFLSYYELLASNMIPQGNKLNFDIFTDWARKVADKKMARDPNKLYEEFRGVITGNSVESAYLSKDEYLKLGIKQSIFSLEERPLVYEMFEKYLIFLKEKMLNDVNLLTHECIPLCKPKYDFVVVDEVQDFTQIQLDFILRNLITPDQFILCGDSHQIIHPNFFSWSKIKSFFYQQSQERSDRSIFILNQNYRNSSSIIKLANNILKLKNARFGSIDKESHYLSDSKKAEEGEIHFLSVNEELIQDLNQKTKNSINFAVIVLHDYQKHEAKKYFNTPLIFSVYEAKGLEYDNVILYNFISSEEESYREIAYGVTQNDLEKFAYRRNPDKSDRSIEIFKFYINALYVAITRSIKNIYIIENLQAHPLLKILQLNLSVSTIKIDQYDSSEKEWKEELRRLKVQGKLDQVREIEKRIIKPKQVPWHIVTQNKIRNLMGGIVNKIVDEKSIRTIFEWGLVYDDIKLIDGLKEIFNYSFLHNSNKYLKILEKKLYSIYSSTEQVISQVDIYGIDFRNHFNQTPLMIAVQLGNVKLIEILIERGADINLFDGYRRTPLQIALYCAIKDKKYAEEKLSLIYDLLCPDTFSLSLDNKFIKYDKNQFEFFFLNFIIAFHQWKLPDFEEYIGLSSKNLLDILIYFPKEIVSESRKNRKYLSNFLSKNAHLNDKDTQIHKLFMRMKKGTYILYPDILMRFNLDLDGVENQEWEPITLLFWAPSFSMIKLGIIESIKDYMAKFRTVDKETIQKLDKLDVIAFLKSELSMKKNTHSSKKHIRRNLLSSKIKDILLGLDIDMADVDFNQKNDFNKDISSLKNLINHDQKMLEILENFDKISNEDLAKLLSGVQMKNDDFKNSLCNLKSAMGSHDLIDKNPLDFTKKH